MIRIRRDSGSVDKNHAYKIVLDGAVIGKIKDGQQVIFKVPSGPHQLYVMIDLCRSNIVDFQTDGSLVEFKCVSNLQGIKSLFKIIYIAFLRSQYIRLVKG